MQSCSNLIKYYLTKCNVYLWYWCGFEPLVLSTRIFISTEICQEVQNLFTLPSACLSFSLYRWREEFEGCKGFSREGKDLQELHNIKKCSEARQVKSKVVSSVSSLSVTNCVLLMLSRLLFKMTICCSKMAYIPEKSL